MIRKLRFVNLANILDNYSFSENSIALYLGFHLNFLELFYLRSVYRNLLHKFENNKNKVCMPILTFFRKIVKGSVKIRKIFVNLNCNPVHENGLRKRIALANYYIEEPERDCNFYKIFKHTKLKNNLRSFIFNFTSQTLYHNAMISHFVEDYNT